MIEVNVVLVSYMRYNMKWFPAYLILAMILIGGIILTGDRETFFEDMSFEIAQIFFLLLDSLTICIDSSLDDSFCFQISRLIHILIIITLLTT